MATERSIGCLLRLLPHVLQESWISKVGEYRYGSDRDIQLRCGVELELALNLARPILKSANCAS